MSLPALTCPHCGAPVGLASTFCAYCRAPIHVRQLYEIDAPRHPRVLDFTVGASPPPQLGPYAESVRGVGLRLTAPSQRSIVVLDGSSCRNASTALTATVHDPDGCLELGARVSDVGEARVGYGLRVQPHVGAWSLVRFVGVPGGPPAMAVLHQERHDPRATRGAARVRVELRIADCLLQVRIDDHLVHRAEDPCFRFGKQQWGVGSLGRQASATLIAFEYAPL